MRYCQRGHAITPENTQRNGKAGDRCRICRNRIARKSAARRYWEKKAALALATVALASCAHTAPPPEPVVRTVTVNVPTPVSCVPARLGPPPAYTVTPKTLDRNASPEDGLARIVASWLQMYARLGEVEPVVAACRTALTGPSRAP